MSIIGDTGFPQNTGIDARQHQTTSVESNRDVVVLHGKGTGWKQDTESLLAHQKLSMAEIGGQSSSDVAAFLRPFAENMRKSEDNSGANSNDHLEQHDDPDFQRPRMNALHGARNDVNALRQQDNAPNATEPTTSLPTETRARAKAVEKNDWFDNALNVLSQKTGLHVTLGKKEVFSLVRKLQENVDLGIPMNPDPKKTKFTIDMKSGKIALNSCDGGMSILSFGVKRGKLTLEILNDKQAGDKKTQQHVKAELGKQNITQSTGTQSAGTKRPRRHGQIQQGYVTVPKRVLTFNSIQNIASAKVTADGIVLSRKK